MTEQEKDLFIEQLQNELHNAKETVNAQKAAGLRQSSRETALRGFPVQSSAAAASRTAAAAMASHAFRRIGAASFHLPFASSIQAESEQQMKSV